MPLLNWFGLPKAPYLQIDTAIHIQNLNILLRFETEELRRT